MDVGIQESSTRTFFGSVFYKSQKMVFIIHHFPFSSRLIRFRKDAYTSNHSNDISRRQTSHKPSNPFLFSSWLSKITLTLSSPRYMHLLQIHLLPTYSTTNPPPLPSPSLSRISYPHSQSPFHPIYVPQPRKTNSGHQYCITEVRERSNSFSKKS